uniref:Mediator of RNA polymerase II transcription subunit 4 n=1 Tax=Meloidogyne enterolobii TaxID=390850 RepID=A0A6V7WT78_MELEN|nr:unnamed protein product [Meloidogyne enterolobii]
MYLKSLGLKEQLTDVINDLELLIKQILECLYIDKKLTEKELQSNISFILEQYNQKQMEFVDLLNRVNAHQERETYIRTLEGLVDSRENLISKIASELKIIDNSLVEATFQAEKKLKSVKQSEMNRVFSEDIVRYAHLISKNHSVASSVYWQQGDPSRPYPTEANFRVSNLLLSRTQQINQMNTSTALFNIPGMPRQKTFTPNARTVSSANVFLNALGGTTTAGSSGSPRGRPPGSGTGPRLSSPAMRNIPKILQRSSSQQSPRFGIMMGAAGGSQQQQQGQMVSPSTAATMQVSSHQHPQGSYIMSSSQQQLQMSINLPPGLKQQQTSNDGTMQIPKVEQMSSDSSSSSSSGDEEDGK